MIEVLSIADCGPASVLYVPICCINYIERFFIDFGKSLFFCLLFQFTTTVLWLLFCLRLNTLLAHMPEFTDTFRCPLGSKMRVSDQCEVFQFVGHLMVYIQRCANWSILVTFFDSIPNDIRSSTTSSAYSPFSMPCSRSRETRAQICRMQLK